MVAFYDVCRVNNFRISDGYLKKVEFVCDYTSLHNLINCVSILLVIGIRVDIQIQSWIFASATAVIRTSFLTQWVLISNVSISQSITWFLNSIPRYSNLTQSIFDTDYFSAIIWPLDANMDAILVPHISDVIHYIFWLFLLVVAFFFSSASMAFA